MHEFTVHCAGLVKRYEEVVAVDGLDLDVSAGECFGLLGPNGAGKTTTVEILHGILTPDAGTVEVLGQPWTGHAHHLRQRIGSQLQETIFPDKLKVREVVELFRSFYHEGLTVEAVLDMVRLAEKQDAWVKKLSGGQKQRLAVATAMVGDPELLFLDEPTTGLDPQARLQLWDIITDFKARGRTVLLTTHYMEEAARLCDRVGIVDHGRMIALGTPNELIASLGAEHLVELTPAAGATLDHAPLRAIEGVAEVASENGRTRISVSAVHEVVPRLLEYLSSAGIELANLTTHHATLEDVFIALTGRHLRES